MRPFHSPFSRLSQHGFTLIELVIVIVILGVISAIALPKFSNLSNEAMLTKYKHIGVTIETASALNLVALKAKNPSAFVVNEADPCSIASVLRFIPEGLPSGAASWHVGGASFPSSCSAPTDEYAICSVYNNEWGSGITSSPPFKVYCAKN